MNISKIQNGTFIKVVVGTVAYFARPTAPTGWLPCDGSSLLQNDYNELYSVIEDTYKIAGDPSNEFRVPDLRGTFIRGLDLNGLYDANRQLTFTQSDYYEQHRHWMSAAPIDDWNFTGTGRTNYQYHGLVSDASSYINYDPMDSAGKYTRTEVDKLKFGDEAADDAILINDNETRPRNIALLACIKY